MSTGIKTILSKQIPEFVKEDHPLFVDFLEAYYEFLDQTETREIESVKDLDVSLERFALQFKKELDLLGEIEYQFIDKALLLRKVKQIYTAKGTESTYKFLFKAISGESIEITYPWDSVLKASDGRWIQENSVFVEFSDLSVPETLPGNSIFVVNSASQRINILVKSVKKYRDNIYEIRIDRKGFGDIQNYSNIVFNSNVVGTLIPTTVSYRIESPGVGYSVGDLIYGNTIASGTTISQIIKVTGVDSNGGITKIEIIKFGAGYNTDFFLYQANVLGEEKANFSVIKAGTTLLDIPDDSKIEQYVDFGEIISPSYWVTSNNPNNSYSKSTYVGEFIQQFYTETINQENTTEFTLIRFVIGPTARYAGYYKTNDGFLSDGIYLQDSRYWQKYSYVLEISQSIEDYILLLKSYIHPAGTAIFGGLNISTSTDMNVNGTCSVE
jgi:hypothetical protein